ncbi:MAG: hypothetical protein JWQ40_3223 [Segetibacter sp.]|nr:hypothetical protein [Segetibacter sp.]
MRKCKDLRFHIFASLKLMRVFYSGFIFFQRIKGRLSAVTSADSSLHLHLFKIIGTLL